MCFSLSGKKNVEGGEDTRLRILQTELIKSSGELPVRQWQKKRQKQLLHLASKALKTNASQLKPTLPNAAPQRPPPAHQPTEMQKPGHHHTMRRRRPQLGSFHVPNAAPRLATHLTYLHHPEQKLTSHFWPEGDA